MPRWVVLNLTFVVISGVLLVASLHPWITATGFTGEEVTPISPGSPWGGFMVAIVAAGLAIGAMVFRLPVLSAAVMFAGGVGGLFAAADYVRLQFMSIPDFYHHPTVWLQLACVACAGLAVGGLGATVEYWRLTRKPQDPGPVDGAGSPG